MTIDVTTRQKLVRVISSAAICGLSFSFIIGEAVDAKAKQIHRWSVDSSLLPSAFLPTLPGRAALASITLESMQDKMAALNFPSGNMREIAAAPPASAVFADSLRTILAAPMAEEAVSDGPAKHPVSREAAQARARELPIQDVEKVLLSIHDATNLLSDFGKKKLENSGAVASGGVILKSPPLIERADHVSQLTYAGAPPPARATATPPSRNDVVIAAEDPWSIRGRVIAEGARLEPGHFEIGLFSKIDQDGVPVGFPLVQQILRAGQTEFSLKIPPHIGRGYLYGEYITTKSGSRTWIAPPVNPWQRGDRQVAELVMRAEDKVATVAAASAFVVNEKTATMLIKGTVATQFASKPIYQSDVVVKVRGRRESARTDKNGSFRLEIPRFKGSIYLEFLKTGYHPTLVAVPASEDGRVISVELASRDAVEQIAMRLGIRQVSTKGVFIGKMIGAEGVPLKGATVQASLKADGPFYFSESGVPSADAKATTSDGRFLFFNLEPGSGFVDASVGGEPVAPFVLSVVEGGEFVVKTLTPESGSLKGRLFDPVAGRGKLQPVAGARIRIEGSSDWSITDSYGAFSLGPMKWMRGERLSIEFSAAHYNNHRYLTIPEEQSEPLNLFAFPATYLHRLGASMGVDIDSYSGIVMGKVSGPSVRIDAMADHSPVNSAQDFYFDAMGRLRGSHSTTDPRFGTYVIFNVPKGRTLLHGNDASGVLRYSESIISSPASVSVIMD